MRFLKNSLSVDRVERGQAQVDVPPDIGRDGNAAESTGTNARATRRGFVVCSRAKPYPNSALEERQETMRNLNRTIFACALAGVALVAMAARVQAQEPHYLKALSDLRTARDYIQSDHRPQFEHERHIAVDEINKAIDEIKHAAWDDGKQTKYAPPPHAETDPWHPLREAVNWIDAAMRDVREGFDQPANQGLRERAVGHMQEARRVLWSVVQAPR